MAQQGISDEQLVREALEATPLDGVLAVLAEIAGLDRFQASLGIEQAAERVRAAALEWGLADASVLRFAADGKVSWWDWEAPSAWTPTVATLEIGDGPELVRIDHSQSPFSIASCSASTPAGGLDLELVEEADWAGSRPAGNCLLLIDGGSPLGTERLAALARSPIAGFVTDLPARGGPAAFATGRIELPGDSRIFAFSTTPDVMQAIRRRAAAGARARARVEIDRSASMPVVTGRLPGRTTEEVWVVAHLCHPRPSANDNASGVAALLGALPVLAAIEAREDLVRERSLRFVWGPEFLGTVALLHGLHRLGLPGPAAVVNVDMVGEDQSGGDSPFIVERHPGHVPGTLNAIAEAIVGEVFRQTADSRSSWQACPFRGFSDHALFASPPFEAPAIQLAHYRDPFNHSAGDSVDKVSTLEMHRATAATAAIAYRLVHAPPAGRRPPLRRNAAKAGLGADRSVRGGGDFVPGRSWAGPLNLRQRLSSLEPGLRRRVHALLDEDRTNHAWLYNIASRIDGRRSFGEIIDDVAGEFGEPLSPASAKVLAEAVRSFGLAVRGE